jgi:hypothetical protein
MATARNLYASLGMTDFVDRLTAAPPDDRICLL